MKIYIAGKVTGEPVMECIEKFQRAKIFIESLGHQAVIPFEIPGMTFGIEHADAMALCLPMVELCDAIYLLKDWTDSPGAMDEWDKAVDKGKPSFYEVFQVGQC